MKSIQDLNREMYIFGSLFLLSNRLQVIIDQGLAKHNITAKQWFLMAAMSEFFPEPPTIKTVAAFIGSSHQNVKQLALKLEKNGYMELKRDEKDSRATKLILTDKCVKLGESRSKENADFMALLFSEMNDEEIQALYNGLTKLYKKVNEL